MDFFKKHRIKIFWSVIIILFIYFAPSIFISTRAVNTERKINEHYLNLQTQLKKSIEVLENENSANLDAFYQEKDSRLRTGKVKAGESIIYLRGLPNDYNKEEIFPHNEIDLQILSK